MTCDGADADEATEGGSDGEDGGEGKRGKTRDIVGAGLCSPMLRERKKQPAVVGASVVCCLLEFCLGYPAMLLSTLVLFTYRYQRLQQPTCMDGDNEENKENADRREF